MKRNRSHTCNQTTINTGQILLNKSTRFKFASSQKYIKAQQQTQKQVKDQHQFPLHQILTPEQQLIKVRVDKIMKFLQTQQHNDIFASHLATCHEILDLLNYSKYKNLIIQNFIQEKIQPLLVTLQSIKPEEQKQQQICSNIIHPRIKDYRNSLAFRMVKNFSEKNIIRHYSLPNERNEQMLKNNEEGNDQPFSLKKINEDNVISNEQNQLKETQEQKKTKYQTFLITCKSHSVINDKNKSSFFKKKVNQAKSTKIKQNLKHQDKEAFMKKIDLRINQMHKRQLKEINDIKQTKAQTRKYIKSFDRKTFANIKNKDIFSRVQTQFTNNRRKQVLSIQTNPRKFIDQIMTYEKQRQFLLNTKSDQNKMMMLVRNNNKKRLRL